MAVTAPITEKGYATPGVNSWLGLPIDYDETPDLLWPHSVHVFDRMRRDPQVTSVLSAVMLPLRQARWLIDPAGARSKVVQLVAEDLGLPVRGKQPRPAPRTKGRFSWDDHLRLALRKIIYGFSAFEQTYQIVNGQARLRKLGWRPPQTISRFEVARDGGLLNLYQHAPLNPASTIGEVQIPVSQLVMYCHEREGGNWAGRSALRAAYGAWILKDAALRTQAVALDRNGLGIPVYTASQPPGDLSEDEMQAWSDTEVQAGLAITTALRGGENAGVSKPFGSALELMGVTGKTPDANPTLRYYDEQIAGSVLANFLKLGGSDSTGSYALGETFANFFVLSLQTLAADIADVATQHIVEDLVDLNFGEDEPAPRITFDEIGARQSPTAQAILQLVQCGAVTPDEQLEGFLRTSFGLPVIDQATRKQPVPIPAPTPTSQEAPA